MFPLIQSTDFPLAPVTDAPVSVLAAERVGLAGMMDQVGQGCESAACSLVEEYYPHVIRSHLPARTAEEDIAQEVFMKMFSRLDQFRWEQPFAHWLARIATNCCIDLLRKQRVRPEVRFCDLRLEEEAFLTACYQDESQLDTSPSQDGMELVDKLLGSLKPDQQLVVRLLDVEQKSVKEICNHTGWSASKVARWHDLNRSEKFRFWRRWSLRAALFALAIFLASICFSPTPQSPA